MTKSDIAALTDRSLDLAVAEHIFGWQWRRSSNSGRRSLFPPDKWPEWFTEPADGSEPLVFDFDETKSAPDYSTTGDGMLLVIERMQAFGWFYHVYDMVEIPEHGCRFYRPDDPDAVAMAETMPLAVVKAALLAQVRLAVCEAQDKEKG